MATAAESPEPVQPLELVDLPEHYQLDISDAEVTGIRLFKLTNKLNGVVVTFAEFNPYMDVHAFVAWVAARISRAGQDFDGLFAEIYALVQEGLSTGAKLAEVFNEYGHASVFDMVPVFLYIDNVSQIAIDDMFNETNQGGAQQESTRFVKRDAAGFEVRDINQMVDLSAVPEDIAEYAGAKWQELQQMEAAYYDKWFDLVNAAYREQFGKIKGLKNRTTDIARTFIPLGSETSAAKLDSGRNWLDIAKQLMGSNITQHRELGEHILTVLKLRQYKEGSEIQADLVELARHDKPFVTVGENMEALKYYLLQTDGFETLLRYENREPREAQVTTVETLTSYEGDTAGMWMAMNYIQSLYPLLPPSEILNFLRNVSDEDAAQISRIILRGHDRYNVMNNLADLRASVMHVVQLGAAYERDLQRQRAIGRASMYLETDDFEAIVLGGFNDLYQFNETDGLMHLREDYNNDMANLYRHIRELFFTLKGCNIPGFDESFILNILPLGHMVQMNMTPPPKQHNYFTDLRGLGNRGGDYGYMYPTNLIWEDVRANDRFLVGMFEDVPPLNPNDPEEFSARG